MMLAIDLVHGAGRQHRSAADQQVIRGCNLLYELAGLHRGHYRERGGPSLAGSALLRPCRQGLPKPTTIMAAHAVLLSPSRRILHARCLVARSGSRYGLSGPPPHGSPARPGNSCRLPADHGGLQPCSRLAAGDLLAAVAGSRHSARIAGSAPQAFHRATVRVVPEGAAADVQHRKGRHRGRYRLVGRRAVQRPPGLGQAAGLPESHADRRGAGLYRWSHRRAVRHGQRVADRPTHGPAARGLGAHQAARLLRPDHSQGIRWQGLFSLRPLAGRDEAGHPQRRSGLHRDGAQLPRPGRTAAALRH
ncbi:hypothetical protein SRABI70_03449 [Pseudomonas sp. Bi70]|nr:hypothetical protein SRABI70_03449 [Pseudomonas sp. Bi70]